MTENVNVYYFGCWGKAGHSVFANNGYQWHGKPTVEFPFGNEIDCSILLPLPEKVGTGTIHFIRGWTVLTWWGNPWDTRGKVNNAVFVKGRVSFDELWQQFSSKFPTLAPQLTIPTISFFA